LFAGRRDPVTPPWAAQAAAARLVNSRIIVFERGGHIFDGLKTPGCKQALIARFLDDPTPHRLDASCAAGAPAPWIEE
jgi:pimeloyl-ACP methyl ester carboxylesterase